ncbi:hypothetical protein SPRG_15788 [Saprolegnia parasitica CBS 223.65]|uniref:Uncharacterized protein n=1 Tax=Saprolegnia parasitica (strain CBS 223.65) TaxID=695850 RepID=A0A067BX14_SAPPC|nr:hypothetical protein SPRG_15788 [Saprolegnia parasitica CBS 223.65]KDO18841.1 hypothetical protein SPRG_15788 [Saprolegnia parasitica CBS 223.65]|eukprot:XP_012210454.1 hypothetical protein SPRG_15788 [Saprolegnia parasitica CBS 223.65]
MQLFDTGEYNYGTTTHNSYGGFAMHKCITHKKCKAKARARPAESGEHTSALTGKKLNGIHVVLRDEIANLCLGGMGPKGGLTRLNVKYMNKEIILRLLPEVNQIKSFHAPTFKESSLVIKDYMQLHEWASKQLCTTREAFTLRDYYYFSKLACI